jgi:hypothetical protein
MGDGNRGTGAAGGIACGTCHVHVRWRNFVYEQVASRPWHRWSTRTSETLTTASTTRKYSSSFRATQRATFHFHVSRYGGLTLISMLCVHHYIIHVDSLGNCIGISCYGGHTSKSSNIFTWFFITSPATPSPMIHPSFYISIVHHDNTYGLSFDRICECGYVLPVYVCMYTHEVSQGLSDIQSHGISNRSVLTRSSECGLNICWT